MSEYVSMNMSMIMYTCIWANQLLAISIRSSQLRFAVQSKSPRQGLETSHSAREPVRRNSAGFRVFNGGDVCGDVLPSGSQ